MTVTEIDEALYQAEQCGSTVFVLSCRWILISQADARGFAEAAGFTDVHLQLNLAVRSPDPMPWHTFINLAPNPLMPSLAEAMQKTLNPTDTERFTAHLQPLVEAGKGRRRLAASQLWAIRSRS